MADTAAFFAGKKKKKKAFKFNANLVDANTVTHTVHVDAPALSTDHEKPVSAVSNAIGAFDLNDPTKKSDDEQWEDPAVTAPVQPRKPVHPSNTAEVLEMKTLDPRGRGATDIAQKLRVEETKAQLAAAREGMEREAAKLKEEQERKEQEKKEKEAKVASRFAGVSSSMGGGKWVPPHMRGGGSTSISTPGFSASRMTGGKLDVQDEELFPDLAAADKILEQKEKDQQPVFKVPKKTPVGGGANWASKLSKPTPKAAETSNAPNEESEKQKEDSAVAATAVAASPPEPTPAPAPTPAAQTAAAPAAAAAPKPALKKKKKKDLSTFKPGG